MACPAGRSPTAGGQRRRRVWSPRNLMPANPLYQISDKRRCLSAAVVQQAPSRAPVICYSKSHVNLERVFSEQSSFNYHTLTRGSLADISLSCFLLFSSTLIECSLSTVHHLSLSFSVIFLRGVSLSKFSDHKHAAVCGWTFSDQHVELVLLYNNCTVTISSPAFIQIHFRQKVIENKIR